MATAYLIAFQPTDAPQGRQSSVRVKVAGGAMITLIAPGT